MTALMELVRGSTEQRIGNALVFTVFALTTAALAVWAVREWRRRQRPDLAVLLLGSAPAIVADAGARLHSGLRTPPVTDHPVLYRAYEIDIAPYMASAFPVYIAVGGYLTVLALRDGWTRRRFWLVMAGLYTAEFCFEQLAINVFDLYGYAGNQPFGVFGLPPAWPAGFIMAGVLSGALVFFFGRHLTGARRLLLIPIPAGAYSGAFGFATWPAAAAVNSSWGPIGVELASAASLGIMALFVYLLTTFLPAAGAEGRAAPDTGANRSPHPTASAEHGESR